jgi:hypothetical protein
LPTLWSLRRPSAAWKEAQRCTNPKRSSRTSSRERRVLIASFGDQDTALLLYTTHTLPVPSVLSAKYFVVDNGKITAIKGLFDRSVFAEAQGESERD